MSNLFSVSSSPVYALVRSLNPSHSNYPPFMNRSRCCDQPICTECFVFIKRADPTTTNLNVLSLRPSVHYLDTDPVTPRQSEPVACPFCVEPNFGIIYIPPPEDLRYGGMSVTPKAGVCVSIYS
jgi:hypothetical protein